MVASPPAQSEWLHSARSALLQTKRGCNQRPASYEALASRGSRMQNPTEMNLADVAAMIRQKQVSPVELTEQCLARISSLNPTVNAFITVTGESALAAARQAEREVMKGEYRGPLHGVPVAVKDLVYTAGVRTTC